MTIKPLVPPKMSKQELANKIYEADRFAVAAFYQNDQKALNYWQGILQSLTVGMKPKQVYKLADLADYEFVKSVEERLQKEIIKK